MTAALLTSLLGAASRIKISTDWIFQVKVKSILHSAGFAELLQHIFPSRLMRRRSGPTDACHPIFWSRQLCLVRSQDGPATRQDLAI